jgi:hypothetical protein
MMAFKIICFAVVGAALGLAVFLCLSFIVVGLLGGILRPLELNLNHLFPIYAGIIFTVMGLPIGAYYGIAFALRSRGFSFSDYYRSIRNFLNGP